MSQQTKLLIRFDEEGGSLNELNFKFSDGEREGNASFPLGEENDSREYPEKETESAAPQQHVTFSSRSPV